MRPQRHRVQRHGLKSIDRVRYVALVVLARDGAASPLPLKTRRCCRGSEEGRRGGPGADQEARRRQRDRRRRGDGAALGGVSRRPRRSSMLLLAAGAEANVANDLGITPLLSRQRQRQRRHRHRSCSQRARTADAASETGVTPLMEAARSGSVEVVRALLDARRQRECRGARSRSDGADVGGGAAASRRRGAAARRTRPNVHARTRVRPLTVMLDQGPRRTVKTSIAGRAADRSRRQHRAAVRRAGRRREVRGAAARRGRQRQRHRR